jgi:hypothetical protein
MRATMAQVTAPRIDPTGELPSPRNVFEAMDTLNARDGFQATAEDQAIIASHGTQLAGHFLIDRQGIVRWAQVEAIERIADVAKFPSGDEILAAARTCLP